MSVAAVGQPTGVVAYPDYPALLSSWINETIPELEDALSTGTLRTILERPDVRETTGDHISSIYYDLARDKVPHDRTLRRNWTQRFISLFEESLRPARKIFPARTAVPFVKWNHAAVPPIIAQHRHGNVTLRPDQVLLARAWGIWFAFENEAVDCGYRDLLINDARQRLAANLRNLNSIETLYHAGKLNFGLKAAWNPGNRGMQFEHLMLDILNESMPEVRHGSLCEDFLQKTDLRGYYPGLADVGAARIQVSMISKADHFARKRNRIVFADQYVLLTPLELATHAIRLSSNGFAQDSLIEDVWISLGEEFTDVHTLAERLKSIFCYALTLPDEHPTGPMWWVPPSIRRFVRSFTEQAAAQAAAVIRSRIKPAAPAQAAPSVPTTASEKKNAAPMETKSRRWKIWLHYRQDDHVVSRKLEPPLRLGTANDWKAPAPIHQWLKDQLLKHQIWPPAIELIVASAGEVAENADYLLEHLPLTEEESKSCRIPAENATKRLEN